jgi:hypothetical protein
MKAMISLHMFRFSTSYMNFTQPHIFKHQIYWETHVLYIILYIIQVGMVLDDTSQPRPKHE